MGPTVTVRVFELLLSAAEAAFANANARPPTRPSTVSAIKEAATRRFTIHIELALRVSGWRGRRVGCGDRTDTNERVLSVAIRALGFRLHLGDPSRGVRVVAFAPKQE